MNLGKPWTCSIYPVCRCDICGEELWSRKAPHGKEMLYTEDGKRHYKAYCNINPTPKTGLIGKALEEAEKFCEKLRKQQQEGGEGS